MEGASKRGPTEKELVEDLAEGPQVAVGAVRCCLSSRVIICVMSMMMHHVDAC